MGVEWKRIQMDTKSRQGKPEGKDNLEDLELDGRVILKYILNE